MATQLDYDRETGRVIWSRDAFHALGEAGFLDDGRYELLEGEIVRAVPPGEPHTFTNMLALRALVARYGWQRVRTGGALAASPISEPIPDVAVVRQPGEAYVTRGIPDGPEFVLVVEVSDSSTWRDLGQKARIYAAAGVPQYWVVDLTRRVVVVHREPSESGYAATVEVGVDGVIEAPGANGNPAPIAVADLLPPIANDQLG